MERKRMKDSAIISGEAFEQAVNHVADSENEALECLEEREPILAGFIERTLTTMAGKLALSGAPTEMVQGCHEHMLGVVLVSLEASRIAHYELWKDAADGEHLEKITAQNEHVTARIVESESDDDESENEV